VDVEQRATYGGVRGEMSDDKLYEVLRQGKNLVESAFLHVTHGGPTRADAEKWLELAREALAEPALRAEMPTCDIKTILAPWVMGITKPTFEEWCAAVDKHFPPNGPTERE
jgi:hypothetical protein